MKHQRSFTRYILPLFVLTPYIVALQPDSTNTTIRFGAGIGSYADVARDCNGNVLSVDQIPFTDAGVAIEHEVAPLHLGAKAGMVSDSRKEERFEYTNSGYVRLPSKERQHTSFYANPSVGLDWKYFGFDAGCVWFSGDGFGKASMTSRAIPQGAMRIGNHEFNNEVQHLRK